MKKQIKKWGKSLVITFTKEDQIIYGMDQGDVIDFSDIIVHKNKRRK